SAYGTSDPRNIICRVGSQYGTSGLTGQSIGKYDEGAWINVKFGYIFLGNTGNSFPNPGSGTGLSVAPDGDIEFRGGEVNNWSLFENRNVFVNRGTMQQNATFRTDKGTNHNRHNDLTIVGEYYNDKGDTDNPVLTIFRSGSNFIEIGAPTPRMRPGTSTLSNKYGYHIVANGVNYHSGIFISSGSVPGSPMDQVSGSAAYHHKFGDKMHDGVIACITPSYHGNWLDFANSSYQGAYERKDVNYAQGAAETRISEISRDKDNASVSSIGFSYNTSWNIAIGELGRAAAGHTKTSTRNPGGPPTSPGSRTLLSHDGSSAGGNKHIGNTTVIVPSGSTAKDYVLQDLHYNGQFAIGHTPQYFDY
ncbi:MAG: hypothetical protein VX237_02970, partial [Chloroflexota bacterium]|nr:hypothetical protein [Chloroflexota bacterium]